MTAPRRRCDDVADALVKFYEEHGYVPTEKELGAKLGMHPSQAGRHLRELRAAGRIAGSGRRLRMVARTERMQ